MKNIQVRKLLFVSLLAASLTGMASVPAYANGVVLSSTTSSEDHVISKPYSAASVQQEVNSRGLRSVATSAIGTCVYCAAKSVQVKKSSNVSKKINKAFVQHLTPVWAKASSYSWSKTTTTNATLSANIGVSAKSASGSIGVSYSWSTSWQVGITIKANPKKYSKLTLRSDFNRYSIQSRAVYKSIFRTTYGKWAYSTLDSPTKDQWLSITEK